MSTIRARSTTHLMLDIAAIIPVDNAAQCPPEGALQCANLPIPETGNP